MPNIWWPIDKFTPKAVSWQVMAANLNSPSSLTGAQRSVTLDALWRVTMTIPVQSQTEAIELQSFLDDMQGAANPVLVFDPQRLRPRALATDNETFSDATLFSDGTGWTGPAYSLHIDASAAVGEQVISLDGMSGITSKVLSRGDLIEIGDGTDDTNVYQVQQDMTPNSSGKGSLRILPPLRQAVIDTDTVRTGRVRLRVRRADDVSVIRGVSWSQEVTLTFVEDKQ